MKKNIGIIFGGKSVEHEVSVITALQVYENIDKSKYNLFPIYIDKKGKWFTHPKLFNYDTFKNEDFKGLYSAFIKPESNDNNLYYITNGFIKKIKKINIDFYFILVHGTNGEDGTIQGLLELNNVAYSGSGIVGSSTGMDKVIMKQLFKANSLPVVDYLWFYKKDWENNRDKIISEIENSLNYPLIVKPANLGSSIGITKATDKKSLIDAIEVAVQYDLKFIVEKMIESVREINCSAIGIQDKVKVSLLEEPVNWEDFLTFEDKYIKGNLKKIGTSENEYSKNNLNKRIIPAKVDKDIEKIIKKYTKEAFTILDCRGIVRVDFLLDNKNNVYINEINTIPGSLSFYLWEKLGINFSKLIDKIIEIGYEYYNMKNEKYFDFSANLFNKVDPFKKNVK